jgi:hypothetical protein
VTDSSSKGPKKPAVPKAGQDHSPLEDLLRGVPEPEPQPEEQAPIILDMEEEPLVLDVAEAAPTVPEPAPAVKAPPAPVPAVIVDDPSLAAPASPAPPAEKKARPDYTSELPSMVPAGVRERFSSPPPAPSLASVAGRPKPKPAAPRRRPAIPRMAIVALVTAVLAGGAFGLYRRLRPEGPVITSVTPPKAEPGQTVTVAGTGFDRDAGGDTVRFGDQAGQVTSASETQLAVTVPMSLAAATDAPVRVQTRGGRSNALFLKIYHGPRVTSVDPPVALPGSEVVLRGSNLAGPSLVVEVGGLPASVKDSTPTALHIVLPDLPLLEGRPVAVSVQVGGESGRPAEVILGRLPLVTTVTPQSGPPGTQVSVRGHGFDPDVRADRVTVGGEAALLVSATANEIVAIVPAPSTAGQMPAPVVVQARGGTSSGSVPFVVMSPSEASFRPHYFPAAAADRPSEDVVLVSTELGPALLLGGRADARSTIERAVRAAAALNAVVEAAASRPAALEVRDKPATGVALAGSPSLLVAATAEDAAAYSREPSARGQRATPRALAELWAALLQDHLTLFMQGQRPLRVAELTPRGKVLLDLFSEAERRGGGAGGGVPTRLVRPLSGSLARSFRDMALILPSGPSTAAAAVAGRWEGTMQEDAAAPRRVTIELRLEGNRLSGSLTTRSGAVAMGVPLEDLRYEKGRLSFALTIGGATHQWSGAVQGAAIEGTIREGTKQAGGFSLRYAE